MRVVYVGTQNQRSAPTGAEPARLHLSRNIACRLRLTVCYGASCVRTAADWVLLPRTAPELYGDLASAYAGPG